MYVVGFDSEDERNIIDWTIDAFELRENSEAVTKYEILAAIGWLYDYSESIFFLLGDEKGLYEVHGSHCSCHGFEDQWDPESTSLTYLFSEKFHCPSYGFTHGDDTLVLDLIRKEAVEWAKKMGWDDELVNLDEFLVQKATKC